MADIIKTLGSSGADFTTWQAWFAARTGGAGDRYIAEITTTGGGLSSGATATGEYAGELIIRAAAGLEWYPENPAAPHAAITSASSFTLTTSSVLKFENVEVRNTAAAPTTALINTNTGVAKTTIRNCWLRGGRYGAINSVAGSTLLVENSLITETARIGVYNFVAGATIRNTVIANCSTDAGTSNSYGGVRKDVAGTVLENVVCFNNGNVDFFGATTTATVSYLASEDATATGTGALTGVTSVAFTDYANNVFTAATGGALDGTGPSGNDRGLVLAGAPAIYITTPVVWDLYARNPATNTGSISITGTYSDATPTAIEARWSGGTWTTIDAAPTGGSYSGSLTGLSTGNGTLEVRMANATTVTASVVNVAIGAKFLFWGQSNFSGRATNAQTYTGTAGWFHKFTVSNNQWQQGADPFDTATANGSIYPLLANLLTTELGCPVGFIGVAMGSTALAAWQPGQSLNTRMVDYYNAATAHSSGGIEAVISWIGESDADAGTAEADFKSRYNTVIDQLKTLTGKDSLLVAPSGLNTTGYANVRQWVSEIAATSANTAPDEVQMWPLFQKIHYETDTETALAADAVGDGIIASFYTTGSTYTLNADGAAWNYSGADASLAYTPVATVYTLNADGASWSYSGGEASTLLSRALQADGQSLQYQSASAELLLNRLLQADGSEWSYAGGVASLTYDTGAATYTLVAEGASFGYSSANAVLLFNRVLSASGVQYSYSGGIASLTYSGAVSVRINGYTMTYGVVPISAAFAN